MQNLKAQVRLAKQRGATGLAYGLVVGLVAIVALGSISSIGDSGVSLFEEVGDTLDAVAAAEPTEAPASTPTPTPTATPLFALVADPDNDTVNEWPSASGSVATGGDPSGLYDNLSQSTDTTPFWVSAPLTGEFTLQFDASAYDFTPGGNVGVVLMNATTGNPYWGPIDAGYGRMIERASYGQWIGGGPFIRRNLPNYSYGAGIGNIATRFVVSRDSANDISAVIRNTSDVDLFSTTNYNTTDPVRIGIFYSKWGISSDAEVTISGYSLVTP